VDGAEVWPKADVWEDGESISTNDLRAYGGKTYKALSNHTAAPATHRPTPTYWDEYFLDASTDDYADLTIDTYGDLRIYWGTQPRVVDSFLNGNEFGEEHPDYVGICYVVLIDFLFGRERTSAPKRRGCRQEEAETNDHHREPCRFERRASQHDGRCCRAFHL
jgi:hypothetical protein